MKKLYLLETKRVVAPLSSGGETKKGQKMKRCGRMLLKTNIEKMSVLRPDTMLMKTNELWMLCHDVIEKK